MNEETNNDDDDVAVSKTVIGAVIMAGGDAETARRAGIVAAKQKSKSTVSKIKNIIDDHLNAILVFVGGCVGSLVLWFIDILKGG